MPARTPWLLLAFAAAIRLVVCLRTELPGRDGASYLWMAAHWGQGDFGALFATVFHPLYPFLVGLLLHLAPGLDVVVAGQLVACGCGALAVLPLFALTLATVGERAAVFACGCYAIGTWFARVPAECMSEGPFFLFVLVWAAALLPVAGTPRRPGLAGAAAALAFLARPEALALMPIAAVWLWQGGERRQALVHSLAFFALAALLPFGYAVWGAGFTLTPKAGFNYDVGVGDPVNGGLLHYARELLFEPNAVFEGIGFVTVPLVLFGLWQNRSQRRLVWLLLSPFLVLCAVVPLLRSHFRFVTGFGVLLLPFAGACLDRCLTLPGLGRLRWLPFVLLVGSEARVFAARNLDDTRERAVGQWLTSRLRPGETIASDMPRLDYFAGQKPQPPRRRSGPELLELAAAPECRFLLVVEGRTELEPDVLHAMGLEPMELPALLCAPAAERRIRLYGKTTTR